jgi:hypothetical protein
VTFCSPGARVQRAPAALSPPQRLPLPSPPLPTPHPTPPPTPNPQREYRPQYRDDFTAPDMSVEHTYSRHRHRFGMVTGATIDEAAYSYGDGTDGRPLFETMGGRDMSPKEVAALFRTVQTDFMAEATNVRAGAAKAAAKDLRTLQHSEFAPPAGGAGAVRIDRGKHVVGMAGGKLDMGKDERTNTLAQGSWMGAAHPSIKHILNPPPPRAPVTILSIPGLGGESSASERSDIPLADPGATHGRYAAFAAKSRGTTDVTATQSDMNRKKGRRVFADDP